MTDNKDPHRQVASSRELRDLSHQLCNEFLGKAGMGKALSVKLAFYTTWMDFEAFDHLFMGPVHSMRNGRRLTMHFCEEGLAGIPCLALQGWIEQEITFHFLALQSDRYAFNFSEEILPHFYVSGSAVNLIRHLVDYLDKGLKRFDATKMVMKMGNGLPQLHLFFFKIRLCPEERDVYETMIPHQWIRASFICRKLQDILPISVLCSQGVGFSGEVEALWWKNYEYLLEGDRVLLRRLREIPFQSRFPHSLRLVSMFTTLRSGLLQNKDRNH